MAGALLASLPPDLACCIFSFIKVRPRLLVVSTVCKRWRVLVLRTITALPPFGTRHLSVYPCLRSLDCDVFFRRTLKSKVRVPATLEELKTRRHFMKDGCLEKLRDVPPLRSFEIVFFSSHDCPKLPSILRRSRTSLTSLSCTTGEVGLSYVKYLQTHTFPNLVSLTIHPELLNDMLPPHANQLTHLSVPNDRSTPLPVSKFPKLISLSISSRRLSAELLAGCPQLRSLELFHDIRDDFPSSLPPVELRIILRQRRHEMQAPNVAFVASLDRLVEFRAYSLPFFVQTDMLSQLLSRHTRSSLTSLNLGEETVSCKQLARIPNLQTLRCGALDGHATLSTLRSLTLATYTFTPEALPKVLDQFPSLLYLSVLVRYPKSRSDLRKLIHKVHRLESSELRELHLELLLMAQSYKAKCVERELCAASRWLTVTIDVDDRSSETQVSTPEYWSSDNEHSTSVLYLLPR